jgi:hypothetical protein
VPRRPREEHLIKADSIPELVKLLGVDAAAIRLPWRQELCRVGCPGRVDPVLPVGLWPGPWGGIAVPRKKVGVRGSGVIVSPGPPEERGPPGLDAPSCSQRGRCWRSHPIAV